MPNTANWCFQSKCSNISAEGLHFSAFHIKMGQEQPLGCFVSVCAGGSGDVWGFQGVGVAGEEGDRRG